LGSALNENAKKRRREWVRTYIRETAYEFMVVDEAVEVNEPSTVGPLSRLAEGGRVVLVGDPMQLGCVGMSSGAGEAGLETSLYERLGDVFVVKKCLLGIQFRMHPFISACPNRALYSNLLRNYESASHLTKPRGFPCSGSSTAFIHVSGQ